MAEWDIAQTYLQLGGTQNLPTTNELPIDMHDRQFDVYPEETALTTILGKLADGDAKNVRLDWIEVQQIQTTLKVAAAVASNGTSLTVTGGGLTAVVDSIVYNERTFDQARVSVVTSDTALTIVRDTGGTTGAAWIVGDILHVLLPEVPEDDDDTARDSMVTNANLYSYVQLYRVGFRVTRTQLQMTPHPGAPTFLQQLQVAKYREFRIKKEKLLWMGGRATSGTAPATRRQTPGVISRLRNGSLYKDYSGFITESGFENHLGEYFDNNPMIDMPIVFMAPNVHRIVSRFNKAAIRTTLDKNVWGLSNITEYKLGGKTVGLVECPLFITPYSKGWYFILDVKNRMQLKTLERDAYVPDPGIQYNRSERARYMYRGQSGLLLANESAHSMAVNAFN